jgi:hypothetical protein
MGGLAIGRRLAGLSWLVAAVIVGLDLLLLFGQVAG